MGEKLRVGIIGMGAIGTVHSNAYNDTGEAQIAGICDLVPEKLASHGQRLGVEARYLDYRDLLKSDVEAVSICVPNYLHAEMAIAALRAGKHVLLEKPMTMNAGEASRVIAARKKSGKTLQIGMVWRQAPHAQVLRDYVASGQLGEVYHIRAVMIRRRGIPGMGGWFTTKAQSGGGPMIDIGVHWFDMSMWISGLWNPTSVSARNYAKFGPRMKNYRYVSMWAGPPNYKGVYDVEDYSAGFVRFGAKATMSFEVAWAANAESEAFVEILGDQGGARVQASGRELTILTEHEGRVADIKPQFPDNNRFAMQASKFIAACHGKGEPAATAEEGRVVMKLIDAIYKSSDSGKEVLIKA